MRQLAWSIFLLLPLGAVAADIYRSVDENGRIVYSDRPGESEAAERIEVATSAGRAAPGSASAGAEEEESGEAAGEPPLGAEIPREATPEEIAADRARNCEYAQQMHETYSTAHRLYRTGPDGERQYLSDAEIDEARAKAQSNVAEWCD